MKRSLTSFDFRFGTYGTDEAIKAGLDLEMPGPPRWRTPLLIQHHLSCQKLNVDIINERVITLLNFVQKMARKNPDIVYGDGHEGSQDSPKARQFCRKVAAEGMVLLKNYSSFLPITSKAQTIAVIGPNAKGRVISGGGSAFLKPTYVVTPWDAIQKHAKGITVQYALGCYGV